MSVARKAVRLIRLTLLSVSAVVCMSCEQQRVSTASVINRTNGVMRNLRVIMQCSGYEDVELVHVVLLEPLGSVTVRYSPTGDGVIVAEYEQVGGESPKRNYLAYVTPGLVEVKRFPIE